MESIKIASVTGPMLLGHLFNYALMGVLALQVYIYAISFPKDRWMIKGLVYAVFFLDILQTAAASHYAWYVLASGWGNPMVLRFTPWTLACVPPLSGFIALLVQFFFSWRIFVLGIKKRYLPILGLIVVSAIGSCTAALYAGILSAKLRDVTQASKLDGPVTGWLSGSTGCDLLITITLVYQLASRKGQGFGTFNHVLHNAIRMSVETGAITSIVVTVELILYLQSNLTSWYFMLGMVIGKLYSNSLLATLNARASTYKPRDTTEQHSEVHVWRATQPIEVSMDTATVTATENSRGKEIELGSLNDSRNTDSKIGFIRGEKDKKSNKW